MCTLTFIPLQENSYLFTSNRDESPKRGKVIFPEEKHFESLKVLFPKDKAQGGTWIATASSGASVCLLNGAFEPHKHEPPYRKSRGLVVLDVFNFSGFDEFSEKEDLQDIEPFTLVSIEPSEKGLKVTELRWDGQKKHVIQKAADTPHLWASASLYSPESLNQRKTFFENWLKNEDYNWESLKSLHLQMKMGDFEEDFSRTGKKPPVETMSITGVNKMEDKVLLNYLDLKEDKEQLEQLGKR